jgi:ribosome-binding factor A
MSHRKEQLASALHRAVQAVITRGLNDPRIRGMISVTRVQVSEDKRNATIYISVMPADKAELTMHGLKAAGTHIRRGAGEIIDAFRMPEFTFKLDKQFQKQAVTLAAIAKVRDEDPPADAPPADPDGTEVSGEAGESSDSGDITP